MGQMIADQLAEDDGPVVIERRRSRHGNYYEEIPTEPEPVPVQPEPVPEGPVWDEAAALEFVKALEKAKTYVTTATWAPPQEWKPTTTTGGGIAFTSAGTSGYSISLNDVIGSYKGHIIGGTTLNGVTFEGVYDPDLPTAINAVIDAKTKECSHTYWTDVGTTKFTFPKNGKGGQSHQPVKCADCGHEWIQDRQF